MFTSDMRQNLLGVSGLFVQDDDATVSAGIVGTDLVLTKASGDTITVDLTPALTASEVFVTSGAYNGVTEEIDLTLNNGSVVSFPVSALLPVTTDATISGDGSGTPLSIELSADAGQILVLGTDGKILATAPIQTPSVDAGNLIGTGTDTKHLLKREDVPEFSRIVMGGASAQTGERIFMQATGNVGFPSAPNQGDEILITAGDTSIVTCMPSAGTLVGGNTSFVIQPDETFIFVFTGTDWKATPRGAYTSRFMKQSLAP